MAASKFPTRLYNCASFLESAGCILFDFRETGLDPLSHSLHKTGSQNVILKQEPKVVLFYSNPRQEFLLPKGRRNIGESRKDAAIRETFEEVGIKCSLLPVTLHSRATSVNPSDDRVTKDGYTVDEPRTFHRVTDAFMSVLRQTAGSKLGSSYSAADGTAARQVRGVISNDKRIADLAQRNASREFEEGEEVMKFIWWYIGYIHEDQGTEEEIASRELEPGCDVVSVPMSEAVVRCSFSDDADVVQRAVEIVRETFKI